MNWQRWWAPVVIIVLVIVIFRCCFEDTPPPTPVPYLVIKHRDTGDWIDFSNMFRDIDCVATSPTYRTGLLFQFGDRSPRVAYFYREIQIYANHSLVPLTYPDSVWVNVISEHDAVGEPITPKDVFGLYPNASKVLGESICGPCVQDVGGCARNRCISGDMKTVKAVVTYWQGKDGYDISARPGPDACSGDTFQFSFLDRIRVDVYQPDGWWAGTSMGTPDTSFALGEVDSIVVVAAASGPDRGDMQPPAWPFP